MSRHHNGYQPPDNRALLAQMQANILKLRIARTELYDDGYALIQLGGVVNFARHHRDLFVISEEDIEILKMEDFEPMPGYKKAWLADILALPETKRAVFA